MGRKMARLWDGLGGYVNSVDNYRELYNFGVCGDTSESLLERFHVEATKVRPDIIVFAVGVNDSKYHAGTDESYIPIDAYSQNLETLISIGQDFTPRIYLVGASKVADTLCAGEDYIFTNDVIGTYNKVMADIANSFDIGFIDVFDTLNSEDDFSDGLHPNTRGYEKMFNAIVKQIDLS